MARKRYSDEDALNFFREIEVQLHHGLDVECWIGFKNVTQAQFVERYWLKYRSSGIRGL